MDFHTLSRRDLQALCKKNKIPANLTNLAMADALQALQTVEGLVEVLAHPATETPAKSMAATPSVYRASNRQRTVKEEPETSKLTKSHAKVQMAQSTLKNPENGTVLHAYSTRRSTRLLEKQMCQLSIKENESMVDAKAILEKDSQDMQRQFSQDMENSLAPDKSNVTKEATEEPSMVDVSVQHMDVVLKKEAGHLDNAGDKNEEPNLVEIPVQNMDEKSLPFEPSVKLKNDDVHLEEKECCKGDDEVQPMQEDANDLEETNNMNGVDAAHDASSPPITMNEDHIVLGSESNATDVLIMQEAVVEQLGIEETGSSDIPCNAVSEDDDAEAAQSDSGEFDFLSDSSPDSGSDNSEDVDQPLVAPEPLLDGDMANGFGNIKNSESAEQDNEVKDYIPNQSSSKNSARKQLGTLQEENMSFAATGTPIEKKSLRQLKKMVKEIRHKKQQAVEKPATTPLQVHQENV